ncbi:MAG: hypothetical protein AAGG11_01055 [Pseudomonadota bacterium]
MIVSTKHRFVFLANRKCASSSLVNALRPHASVIAEADARLRHTNFRQYRSLVVPWLEACTSEAVREYRVFALYREPTEWLSSWFRFRRMLRDEGADNTGNSLPPELTWEAFLEACCSEPRPDYATVGSQADFVQDESGSVGPDALFAYDKVDELVDALSAQVRRRIVLPNFNVSPAADYEITEQHYRYCRSSLSCEYDVYDTL